MHVILFVCALCGARKAVESPTESPWDIQPLWWFAIATTDEDEKVRQWAFCCEEHAAKYLGWDAPQT